MRFRGAPRQLGQALSSNATDPRSSTISRCLVLDYHMPTKTGLDLLERVNRRAASLMVMSPCATRQAPPRSIFYVSFR